MRLPLVVTVDWQQVRRAASKKIDIKKGEANAEKARAFRASKGEPIPESQRAPVPDAAPSPTPQPSIPQEPTPPPAPSGGKPDEQGPGIHHDPHTGQFQPGHHRRLPGVFAKYGLPDLAKIIGFIQTELNLGHWAITSRWVDDLRDGEGKPIAGLCQRDTEVPRALLSVRTPRAGSAAELKGYPS